MLGGLGVEAGQEGQQCPLEEGGDVGAGQGADRVAIIHAQECVATRDDGHKVAGDLAYYRHCAVGGAVEVYWAAGLVEDAWEGIIHSQVPFWHIALAWGVDDDVFGSAIEALTRGSQGVAGVAAVGVGVAEAAADGLDVDGALGLGGGGPVVGDACLGRLRH